MSNQLKNKKTYSLHTVAEQGSFVLFCEAMYARTRMWVCGGEPGAGGHFTHWASQMLKEESSVMPSITASLQGF